METKTLFDNFVAGPVDSDKVNERALADAGNADSFGASNFQLAFTLWRYWLAAGGVDTSADAAFAALKVKGATLWGYVRRTDKLASAAWAAADEIAFGCEFTNDNPQTPDGGGWIKYRIPCAVQRGWTFQPVAASA